MNSSQQAAYRRVVVGLCHEATDAQTLRTAAEFALLLGLSLHCLCIEDEALLALAQLPFAREISVPTHTWAPLTLKAVEDDIQQSRAQVRRLTDEVMRDVGVSASFELSQGDPAECLAAICQTEDIIAISGHVSPTTPPTHSRRRLGIVANDASRSTLILPAHIRQQSGQVVAMPTDASDIVLDIAARVTTTAKENLLVLFSEQLRGTAGQGALERMRGMGLTAERVSLKTTEAALTDPEAGALPGSGERLIVASRGALDPIEAANIVRIRNTPLLLVPSKGAVVHASPPREPK